jgi:hypothetical protein
MEVVCSWCGEKIGQKEPLEDKTKTHGICPVCATGVRAESFRLIEEQRIRCRGDNK